MGKLSKQPTSTMPALAFNLGSQSIGVRDELSGSSSSWEKSAQDQGMVLLGVLSFLIFCLDLQSYQADPPQSPPINLVFIFFLLLACCRTRCLCLDVKHSVLWGGLSVITRLLEINHTITDMNKNVNGEHPREKIWKLTKGFKYYFAHFFQVSPLGRKFFSQIFCE